MIDPARPRKNVGKSSVEYRIGITGRLRAILAENRFEFPPRSTAPGETLGQPAAAVDECVDGRVAASAHLVWIDIQRRSMKGGLV